MICSDQQILLEIILSSRILGAPAFDVLKWLEKAQVRLLQGERPNSFWRMRGYLEHSPSMRLPAESSCLSDLSLYQQETTTWAQTTYRILGTNTFLLLYCTKFWGALFHSSQSLIQGEQQAGGEEKALSDLPLEGTVQGEDPVEHTVRLILMRMSLSKEGRVLWSGLQQHLSITLKSQQNSSESKHLNSISSIPGTSLSALHVFFPLNLLRRLLRRVLSPFHFTD